MTGLVDRKRVVRLRMASAAVLAASLALGCGGGAGAETWPKKITLTSSSIGAGPPVRLSDGATVSDDGLALFTAVQLSLVSRVGGELRNETFCEQGVFAALADVPTNPSLCPAASNGTWSGRLFLSGASLHTTEESWVIGLSALVKDPSDRLYRLRVIGDSHQLVGDGSSALSTATVEYEPLPSAARTP